MNKATQFATSMLAVFLLGPVAVATDNLPSPCAAGEVGAGSNCMYLVVAGNVYNPATGDRSVADAGSDVDVAVWIDFDTVAIQGGGFDIVYDVGQVASASWQWDEKIVAFDAITQSGSPGDTGWEGIQIDDFAGNGFGGSTGTRPGFLRLGTLSLAFFQAGEVVVGIAQPYTDATFPNCFAPGVGSGESGCQPTGFYAVTMNVAGVEDSDADGVPDNLDNCTFEQNADQRDSNGDGFGNVCDSDFSGDCFVNFADLQVISATFFSGDPDTDLNGDGVVNFLDLSRMQAAFFAPPGPSGLADCP